MLYLRKKIINIHVKKLPERVYLATSDDVPGLVTQGRTVTEALEIARDVARKLLEARVERYKKAIEDKALQQPLISLINKKLINE